MSSTRPKDTLPGDAAESQSRNTDAAVTGRRRTRRRHYPQELLMAVLLLATIGWVVVAHPGIWAVAAATLLAPVLISRSIASGRTIVVLAVTVGMVIAAVDYVSWRIGVTNWSAWWLAFPLLVAEVFGILHAVGLMQTVWPRASPPTRIDGDSSTQPIFILIPTVNEGVAVLEGTLASARTARENYVGEHPGASVRIVVCNDGRVAGYDGWSQVEAYALRAGVEVITREIGGGAKAGNLENARQQLGVTGDAILIIFDADQRARADFLNRTVHRLDDSRVAWVQTGQYYSNLESPVAHWAEHQQAIFYSVLLPGKSTLNAAFICGTNVVIRAAALDEIGGFPQDSVTEDFAASLELHRRWRSVFVPGKLAIGLGPMDLPAYFKQQDRWAVGTLGTLRTHFLSLVTLRRTGMTIQQRAQYLLAQTHYLSGVKDLVFVLAPIAFLITGIPAVTGADLGGLFEHFVPYFVLSQIGFWLVAAGRTSIRGILIGFATFPTLVLSLLAVLTGRRVAFRITSKQRSARLGVLHLAPHVVGLLACVLALIAVSRNGALTAAEIVTVFWVSYTGLMFVGVLYLGARDLASAKQRRPSRFAFRRRAARRSRFALGGIAAITAIAIGVTAAVLVPSRSSSAFDVPMARAGSLQLGASLAGYRSASDVSSAFPTGLDVVGRTQSIDDNFDAKWASNLTAAGSTPWLTLLLSDRKSKLDADLLGMANGADDAAITRWAQSMREFGAPIYLTMLPAVDARWSKTTAVVPGGIPQDVPRAWARLRSVLDKVGAENVALAWAPALPATDQRFSPAESQIDVVIVTLYSYPNKKWANPSTTLAAVEDRHPGKPIIVEVAAAGTPKRKANWLRSVAKAAIADASVQALIYHDSDPEVVTTDATDAAAPDQAAWSVSSDSWSQSVFASLDTAGEVPSGPFTGPLVSAPTVKDGSR